MKRRMFENKSMEMHGTLFEMISYSRPCVTFKMNYSENYMKCITAKRFLAKANQSRERFFLKIWENFKYVRSFEAFRKTLEPSDVYTHFKNSLNLEKFLSFNYIGSFLKVPFKHVKIPFKRKWNSTCWRHSMNKKSARLLPRMKHFVKKTV